MRHVDEAERVPIIIYFYRSLCVLLQALGLVLYRVQHQILQARAPLSACSYPSSSASLLCLGFAR